MDNLHKGIKIRNNVLAEKVSTLKNKIKDKYCKIKIQLPQSVGGDLLNTKSIDVDDIFVDLNCERFIFNAREIIDGQKPQSFSCADTFSYNNCGGKNTSVVILGLPGAGKSTLLKHLLKQYCNEELVIPVYVELKLEESQGRFSKLWGPAENSVQSLSIADSLRDYLTDYLGRIMGLACDSKVMLQQLYEENFHFVFFCDGLDEISDKQYDQFKLVANMLSSQYDQIHFVISSRQVNFKRADYQKEFLLYSLMEFNTEKQKEYVNKYFNILKSLGCKNDELTQQKSTLLELIEKNATFRRMAKSPILLSLLCVTSDLQNIKNKSQIFKCAIDGLLSNRDIQNEDKQLFIDFLKRIAVVFFKLDKAESFEKDELDFYAKKVFCSQNETTCNRLMSEYLKCGLFDKIEGENQKAVYKFAHRTLWEYLVAEGMVGDAPNIYSRANIPVWQEPIKMWITLIEKSNVADAFRELWKRNKPLTLECMNELEVFPEFEFNELYNNLTKRDKLRMIATLRESYTNPSSEYRKQAINTIEATLTLIHTVERDCEVIYSYLEFLEEFPVEAVFKKLLHRFLDYDNLHDRQHKMAEFGLEFASVMPGVFSMGRDSLPKETKNGKKIYINVDAEEMPAHNVLLNNPFLISKTLVTNQMYYESGFPYVSMVDGKPAFEGNSYSNEPTQPVNYVNWYEAMVFAMWLGYTLPTEAEWEFACRGGINSDTGTIYDDYMKDTLDEMRQLINKDACYSYNSNNQTRIVVNDLDRNINICTQSSLGLRDMLGNLREWCLDWYSDDFYKKCCVGNYPNFASDIQGRETVTYYFDEKDEPQLVAEGFSKITDLFVFDKQGNCVNPIKRIPGKFEAKCLRGGCFDWNESNLRPTYRNHNPANNVYKVNGFRLVNKEINYEKN